MPFSGLYRVPAQGSTYTLTLDAVTVASGTHENRKKIVETAGFEPAFAFRVVVGIQDKCCDISKVLGKPAMAWISAFFRGTVYDFLLVTCRWMLLSCL